MAANAIPPRVGLAVPHGRADRIRRNGVHHWLGGVERTTASRRRWDPKRNRFDH